MTFNEDELDEFFVDKLDLIKQTMPRDQKIARQRRYEYMKKTNNQQNEKPMFSIARLFNRKPKPTSFNRGRSLVPIAAAILLIFGLVFGSWGTVYAAKDSTPNDLLYPIKLVVDYLEEINTVTANPEDITRTTKRDGIQIHDRDTIQGMTGVVHDKDQPMHQYGQNMTWEERGHFGWDDPITPIDDPAPPTPEITVTLTITPAQNGFLWGPGPCDREEELDECGPFGPVGYTYTYTHGLDSEDPPQFKGEHPETDTEPVPAIGWGDGSNQGEGPQQPPETPVQNNDGGDQKKGKP